MNRKSTKPRVFVSYCHTDIKKENLDYFIKSLKEACGGQLDLLIDSDSVKVGDDLKRFMNQVENCVCAIIILTPAYKVKVLGRNGGVNIEFKKIIDKYKIQQDIDLKIEDDVETSPISRFEVIPLLFSGDEMTSIPQEFENLLYEDFRDLRVTLKNGKYLIPKALEVKFQKRIKNISEKIITNAITSLDEFQNYYAEYFEMLFKESKSGWNKPEYKKYIDTLFVKTDVFKKVKSQEAWFIVGRKGSGKSTITDVLPQIDPDKYLTTIPVYADNISLIIIYNIFTTNHEFFSDSKNIYQRLKLFQFGWELFFYISCMYKLVEKYDQRKLSYIPVSQINKLKRFLNNIFRRERISDETDLNVIFTYSFSKLQEFLDNVNKSARNNNLGADLISPMEITLYREFLIPKDTIFDFYKILQKLDRKILFSFDGFDTIFDLFRKESIRGNTDDLIERANFEVDWLNSLLLLVLNQGINLNIFIKLSTIA